MDLVEHQCAFLDLLLVHDLPLYSRKRIRCSVWFAIKLNPVVDVRISSVFRTHGLDFLCVRKSYNLHSKQKVRIYGDLHYTLILHSKKVRTRLRGFDQCGLFEKRTQWNLILLNSLQNQSRL